LRRAYALRPRFVKTLRFMRSLKLKPAGGRPRGAGGASCPCLLRPVAMKHSTPLSSTFSMSSLHS
jgi:hypothetical protein